MIGMESIIKIMEGQSLIGATSIHLISLWISQRKMAEGFVIPMKSMSCLCILANNSQTRGQWLPFMITKLPKRTGTT
jgi:hypothetical protein